MEVYALSRNISGSSKAIALQGDVLDPNAIEQIFSAHTFDAVFHLAAITEHHAIVDDKAATFRTNLQGTMNLLESFNRHCNGAVFLYASTGKVYGKTNEMPITERAYANPQNILGKSKRITEETIELYAVPRNQYLICRIFNIYGEGQKRSFVIPTVIDQINSPIITLGNMTDLRDYLYIRDLIDALIACMKHTERFAGVDYVNIGSGVPANVADIVHIVEELVGKKLLVTLDAGRLRSDETPVEFCSNRKLSELTGWKAQYSLREGIESTLKREGAIT